MMKILNYKNLSVGDLVYHYHGRSILDSGFAMNKKTGVILEIHQITKSGFQTAEVLWSATSKKETVVINYLRKACYTEKLPM